MGQRDDCSRSKKKIAQSESLKFEDRKEMEFADLKKSHEINSPLDICFLERKFTEHDCTWIVNIGDAIDTSNATVLRHNVRVAHSSH